MFVSYLQRTHGLEKCKVGIFDELSGLECCSDECTVFDYRAKKAYQMLQLGIWQ